MVTMILLKGPVLRNFRSCIVQDIEKQSADTWKHIMDNIVISVMKMMSLFHIVTITQVRLKMNLKSSK